jgi:transmembrane sensor
VTAATAWTARQLIFDMTPLPEVAEEFNRYSARRLVIASPTLADFHVTGSYSSKNPESLLRFLRAQPGLRLIETADEIRVTSQ